MHNPSQSVRCPSCHGYMVGGYLSVSQGLKFIRNHDHRSKPMAEHLPGTHAVLRPNRLPAWKCPSCELMLFRYGRKLQRELERNGAFDREYREAAALAALEPSSSGGSPEPDAFGGEPGDDWGGDFEGAPGKPRDA
ncbi:MAG: PF20097 family protein [Planctomycetota bacterium]